MALTCFTSVVYSANVMDKYPNYNKHIHATYFANTYFQAASHCSYLAVLKKHRKVKLRDITIRKYDCFKHCFKHRER
jgi:hypothetical protein